MILASIIIPHHGPQEMLDRCVASIPQREDVEVIAIIDEEGRGAGWARNRGLEKAQGEYVVFADSDDFFHPCFDDFLNTLKNETSDMVIFNADSIELDTKQPSWRANHLNRIIRNKNKAWQERHLRYYFTEPWCRAIRLSLIRKYNLQFSELKKDEDVLFTTHVGYYASTIKVNPQKCYCIGNHTGSVGKSSSDEKSLHATQEAARSNVFMREHNISHFRSRMFRPMFVAMVHLNFSLAWKCWRVMRAEGLGRGYLIIHILRYPRDLSKLVYRKIQSGEIFPCKWNK